MQLPERIREDFIAMARRSEPDIELAHAALLVAAESDPAVLVAEQLAVLERWGDELRARLAPDFNNLQKLARLRAFVYEDLGFRGDHEDYYSPSNSLLHDVLRRRRGVPLTLAIVMLDLGWRVGMPLEGVGFPGHFLVRLTGEPGDLLLDPYRDGMSLRVSDCRELLRESVGGQLEFSSAMLESVGKRAMLARLLRNLKGAWLRRGQEEAALSAIERLLVIDPDDPIELHDGGLLALRLQRYGFAFESLSRWLARAPEAPDREAVTRHVEALRQRVSRMN